MTQAVPQVHELLIAASQLAAGDARRALELFADAARLGTSDAAHGVAYAFEAMARVAAASGDTATAAEAFERAEREASETGDALVLARCRAARAILQRGRAYASAAAAFAAELAHANDLLDAARISTAPQPAMHAARTRLELRRRLPGPHGALVMARLESVLGLSAVELAALAACAALTLQPDIDDALPPAPAWSDRIAAWLAPAFESPPDAASALAALAARGLVVRLGDGRPQLAADVESLLTGRTQPVIPSGFKHAVELPSWGGPGGPRRRALPERVLAILGELRATTDEVMAVARVSAWPLWLVRATPLDPSACRLAVATLTREALVHDKLVAMVTHALDPEQLQQLVVNTAAQLARFIVLAPAAPVVPAGLAIEVVQATARPA